MRYEPPNCILHSDRVAITTAAHIPICKECDDSYQEEARKYLPMVKRDFYQKLLDADFQTSTTKAEGSEQMTISSTDKPHKFVGIGHGELGMSRCERCRCRERDLIHSLKSRNWDVDFPLETAEPKDVKK